MQRIAIVFFTVFAVLPVKAQISQSSAPGLRVFLDCDRGCDRSFLRTDIPIVDWVNDREVSDVHILITRERTGGGGSSHTLNFIGRRWFSSMADTLEYASSSTDTDDERRRGLSKVIKMGLVRYLAKTTLVDRVTIGLANARHNQEASIEVDPWNYWVFRISASGNFRGEASKDGMSVRGDVSANKTTEDWKTRLSVRGNRDESNFSYSDTSITSIRRDASAFALVVKSLTSHWSAGGFAEGNTSSRRNTKASFSIGPSIEYNIFPYSESTEREIRLQYHVRVQGSRYDEITLFGETEEAFLKHTLEARLDLRQPWGNAEFGAEFVHFLTNFSESRTEFHNLSLNAELEVRIIRGLSLDVRAGYSFINDQVYLPKESASEEDILLGRISLPTSYDYRFSMGVTYRFGSIYNNVVNPRFGGF